jgi:hypothetical protein
VNPKCKHIWISELRIIKQLSVKLYPTFTHLLPQDTLQVKTSIHVQDHKPFNDICLGGIQLFGAFGYVIPDVFGKLKVIGFAFFVFRKRVSTHD